MKKINPPTIGSILILIMYVLHQRFHFDTNLLSAECLRKAYMECKSSAKSGHDILKT